MEATDIDEAVGILLTPQEETEAEAPETDETEAEGTQEEVEADEAEEEITDEVGDAQDDEAEEDEAAEEPLFTVKVDGEEQRVTLAELQRSYSGQGYIQKGMKEAAEAKKQAESVYSALQEDRAKLAQLMQKVEQGGIAKPVAPNPEMLETDPIGYMAARARYDADAEAFKQYEAEVAAQATQVEEAQAKAVTAYREEQHRNLIRAIPDLADAAKAGAIKTRLVKTAADFGFSESEIAGVMDARALIMLNELATLRAGKATVEKKAAKARPATKAGAKASAGAAVKKARSENMAKLKRSGSIDDAVQVLLGG